MADDPPTRDRPAGIDISMAHSARIWNYWLGGKDSYPADWAAGDRVRALYPAIRDYAHADRAFLGRAVRLLAGEAGIRQFLDIGTGLPTADNTHEVAQSVAPEARIVYVDNDPLVLAHARALLTSAREGATDYIEADLHDPEFIVSEAAQTLDFGRPVAVLLLGVLMFVNDTDEAYTVVSKLMDAVPSGSYLVLSHTVTGAGHPGIDEAVSFWNSVGTPNLTPRTSEQIAGFFDGLQPLEPGLVPYSRWRPGAVPGGAPDEVAFHCGVARKP